MARWIKLLNRLAHLVLLENRRLSSARESEWLQKLHERTRAAVGRLSPRQHGFIAGIERSHANRMPVETLEPRMLFSADAFAYTVADLDSQLGKAGEDAIIRGLQADGLFEKESLFSKRPTVDYDDLKDRGVVESGNGTILFTLTDTSGIGTQGHVLFEKALYGPGSESLSVSVVKNSQSAIGLVYSLVAKNGDETRLGSIVFDELDFESAGEGGPVFAVSWYESAVRMYVDGRVAATTFGGERVMDPGRQSLANAGLAHSEIRKHGGGLLGTTLSFGAVLTDGQVAALSDSIAQDLADRQARLASGVSPSVISFGGAMSSMSAGTLITERRTGEPTLNTYSYDVDVSSLSTLSVGYSGLSFYHSGGRQEFDAFELALVDANGSSVVPTIGEGRDAFFNITDGVDAAGAQQALAPVLADGVGHDAAGGVVGVDVSGLSGTYTVVARIIGNDAEGPGSEDYSRVTVTPDSQTTYDVLWGIDEDDNALFAIWDINDPVSTYIDFGEIVYDNGASLTQFAGRLETIAVDDSGMAYIVTNDDADGLDGPVLLRIDTTSLDPTQAVVAEVLGRIPVPATTPNYDGVTGLDFDSQGNLYAVYIHPTPITTSSQLLRLSVVDNGGGSFTIGIEENVQLVSHSDAIVIEAEQPDSITSPMDISGTDFSASGGGFLEVEPGNNALSNAPADGIASYTFTTTQSGDHYFWARVIAETYDDDSFWVRVDGGAWIEWNNLYPITEWAWSEIYDHGQSGAPQIVRNWGAGETHTIDIAYREDGAKLDQILLTTDSSYNPSSPAYEVVAAEDLSFDSADHLVVSDRSNNKVYKVDPSNGKVLGEYDSEVFGHVEGVAFNPANDGLVVSETGSDNARSVGEGAAANADLFQFAFFGATDIEGIDFHTTAAEMPERRAYFFPDEDDGELGVVWNIDNDSTGSSSLGQLMFEHSPGHFLPLTGVEPAEIDSDGTAYFAHTGTIGTYSGAKLFKLDLLNAADDAVQTVEYIGTITTASGVSVPGLALDPVTGDLYGVARDTGSPGADSLIRIDKTDASILNSYLIESTDGQIVSTRAQALSFSADGSVIYVSDYDTDEIYAVDPANGNITSIYDSDPFNGLTQHTNQHTLGLELDGLTGDLLGVEPAGDRVIDINVGDGGNTELFGFPTGVTEAEGLAFFPHRPPAGTASGGALTPPAITGPENTIAPNPPEALYSALDTEALADVTGLMQIDYLHSTANAQSGDHFVGVNVTANTLQQVRDQLLLAVDGPGLVEVRLINGQGTVQAVPGLSAGGAQYFDIGHLLERDGNGFFIAGGETGELTLRFRYSGDGQSDFTQRERFDYTLSLLGSLNRPPEFTTNPYAPGEDTVSTRKGAVFSYQAGAVDPDGDVVTLSAVGLPAGAVFDADAGVVTWDTAPVDEGGYAFSLIASDSAGGETTQLIRVEVTADTTNAPPQFETNPTRHVRIGEGYAYDAGATDPDGDALTYSEAGLRGHWSMDDLSGPIAADQSIYGNNGTLYGDAAFKPGGVHAGSLELDGDGDYVKTPFVFDPSTTDLTLSMWARFDQLPMDTAVYGLLAAQANGSTANGNHWLFIEPAANRLFTQIDGGSFATDFYLGDSAWHHYALTVENGEINVYVDGAAVGTKTGVALPPADGGMVFSSNRAETAGMIDGSIDEVRLYDRALSGTEIAHQHAALPWVVDPSTGVVSWSPSADLIGESVGVHLKVTDGRGGADTQDYTIDVYADPANRDPVITNDPDLNAGLPSAPNASVGDVTPNDLISLILGMGDPADQTVSITLPQATPLAGAADIVFVVDESGSMSGAIGWLEAMIHNDDGQGTVTGLDQALRDAGITDVRYGVVGFEQYGVSDLAQEGIEIVVYDESGNKFITDSLTGFHSNSNHGFDLALDTDGVYTVVVQFSGPDNLKGLGGDFSINIADVSGAAVPVSNLDTAFSGTLAAQETSTHTFTANAGQSIYLDSLSGTWSTPIHINVLKPDGSSLVPQRSVDSDDDRHYRLTDSGTYTIEVVNYSATQSASYSLIARDIDATAAALDLDASAGLLSGTIAPDELRAWTFDGIAGQRILTHSMSVLTDTHAKIIKPSGGEFATTLGSDRGDLYTLEESGQYTVLLSSNHGVSQAFDIRVLDPATAPAATLGAAASGSLAHQGGLAVYRVAADSGDGLTMDLQQFEDAGSQTAYGYLRIYHPSSIATGANLFDNGSPNPVNDFDFVLDDLAEGGDYLVVLSANKHDNDTLPISYSFTVDQADYAAGTSALTLNTAYSGTLSSPGDRHSLTFTLVSERDLYIDLLQEDFSLNWRLIDDGGVEYAADDFSDYSSDNNPSPSHDDTRLLRKMRPGNYTVVVDGSASSTGGYALSVSTLGSGTALTAGTPLNNETMPATGGARLYTYAASAGDRIDVTMSAANQNGQWRLFDPYGRTVASDEIGDPQSNIDLPVAGTYTLLVDGDSTGAPTQFSVQIDHVSNTTPSAPSGTPITLGSEAAGTFSASGVHTYVLDLASSTDLYFDGRLDESALTYRLLDPYGRTVAAYNDVMSHLFRLDPGYYTLEVEAGSATGDYAFAVFDVASAASLTLDSNTTVSLQSAGAAKLYSFTGSAGESFFFDWVSDTTDIDGAVHLYDPDGEVLAGLAYFTGHNSGSDEGNIGPAAISKDGSYLLVIDTWENSGTGSKDFRVRKTTSTTAAYAVGTLVEGDIAGAGDRHTYTFNATAGQRLFVDTIEKAGSEDLRINVFGPLGAQFVTELHPNRVGVGATTDDLFVAPVSGEYRVEVASGSDNSGEINDGTGAYAFRVLDVAVQPVASLTDDTTGVIGYDTGVALLTLNGSAAQELSFSLGDNAFWADNGADIETMLQQLNTSGGNNLERGYEGIQHALGYPFRGGAVKHLVVVSDRGVGGYTDELRDLLIQTMQSDQVSLSIINGMDYNLPGQPEHPDALGQDAQGVLYVDVDGQDTYTTEPFAEIGGTYQEILDHYLPLVNGGYHPGTTWDVVKLATGDSDVLNSFNAAFADTFVNELVSAVPLTVVASDPDVQIEYLNAPNGLIEGVGEGDTATFDIRFVGGVTPRSFDLQFIRPHDPSVVYGSIPVQINTDYFYEVRAYDPDGDSPLHYELVGAAHGAAIDPVTGLMQWRPDTAGDFGFTVKVSDGRGGETTKAWTVHVAAQGEGNTAPVIQTSPPQLAGADRAYEYRASATDADGDQLVYYLAGHVPAGMTINPETGLIQWSPTSADIGNHSFELRVTDRRGGTAIQQIELTVENPGPENQRPGFIGSVPLSVELGGTYTATLTAVDPDNDAVTYELVIAPDGMVIDPIGGEIAWTPEAGDLGQTLIVARATDSEGGSSLRSFTIEVAEPNGAPDLFGTPPSKVDVDSEFLYRVQVIDTGPAGLSFSLNNVDARASGMSIDADTGLISWDTTGVSPTGGAPISYTVRVDDAGGLWDEQAYTLDVIDISNNQPASITSTPGEFAIVGQVYSHAFTGNDPEGDGLTWALTSYPGGMTLSAAGQLDWTPTIDQLGEQSFTVVATDPYGAGQRITYTLNVNAANQPPLMIYDPMTRGYVGQTDYGFDVKVIDAEQTQPTLTIGVVDGSQNPVPGFAVTGPDSEGVWAVTGPTFSATDTYTVTLTATDGDGNTDIQGFDLVIATTQANDPPTLVDITRVPGPDPITAGDTGFLQLPVAVGTTYTYTFEFSDPDGDALAIAFGGGTTAPIAPDPANPGAGELGLTVVGTTATVVWTPTVSQQGQTLAIELEAAESSTGELYKMTVPMSVAVRGHNSDPTLRPVPGTEVAAGGLLDLVVEADDADLDPLVFSLEKSSPTGDDPGLLGITIDQTGRLNWSPQPADIGTYSFTARVTDAYGATATKTIDLQVVADTQDPQVSVAVDNSSPLVGDVVTFQVSAADAAGIATRWVTINGVAYGLDSEGRVSYSVADSTPLTVQGFATDHNGRTGSSSEIPVNPYTATQAPTITVTAPTGEAPIDQAVSITGEIDDDFLNGEHVYYRALLIQATTGAAVELGAGSTNAVLMGDLGITIDPTRFANGSYVLRMQASNAPDLDNPGAFPVREVDTWIDIDSGYLKLGNFALSFTDLSSGVSGIPITVSRTYDTLDADVSGDFGYGWSGELTTGSLEITNLGTDDLFDDPFLSSSFAQPYRFGTRLSLTLPGGQEMGFTAIPALFTDGSNQAAAGYVANGVELFGVVFRPDGDSLGSVLEFTGGSKIRLQPDQLEAFGFSSTDTVDVNSVEVYSDGGALRTLDGLPFSPVTAGWDFMLTTPDGAQYTYDPRTGRLLGVLDTAGNKIVFGSNTLGETITSTDEGGVVLGRVQVTRDNANRITAIADLLDPSSSAISYEYDTAGHLVKVTDRSGRTTEFRYGEDHGNVFPNPDDFPEHYLTTVIDGRGVEVAKADFFQDGRLKGITDASGAAAPFSYELDGTQFGLPSGYTIESVADAYGTTTEVVRDGRGNTIATVQLTYDDGGSGAANTYLVTAYRYDGSDRQTHASFQYTVTGQANRFSDPVGLIADENDPGYDPTAWQSITAYDGEGNVASTTDAAGNTTYYADYDRHGNPRTIADANGTTRSVFDDAGRLTRSIDPLGNITNYLYDAADNLTSLEQFDDNGTPVVLSTYAYDTRGRLTSVTDPSGVERFFIYDAQDRQTHSWWIWEDPQNTADVLQVSQTVFDEEGRTVQSKQYTITGSDGAFTGYTMQDVLDDTASATPDWTTSTAYDAAGNPAVSTDQFGNKSYTLYDSRGSVEETRTQAKDAQGAAVWIVSRTFYDDNGRAIASSDPFVLTNADDPYTIDATGVAVPNPSFDRANDVLVTAAADLRVSQTTYDALGRPTHHARLGGVEISFNTITDRFEYTPVADGNLATDPGVRSYSQTVYNTDGRVDYTISATGVVTESVYDAAGRQTQTTVNPAVFQDTTANPHYVANLATSTSTTAYDTTGRVLSTTDALGRTTHFTYDALGRNVKTTYHDGSFTLTGYDTLGRRDSATDALGRRTDYEYDTQGRLTAVVLPNVDTADVSSPRPRYEYAYDAYGNQTLIRDPEDDSHAGTINYTPTSGQDKETGFTYDHRGRQVSRTLPDGLTETMVYDDTPVATVQAGASPESSVGGGQLAYTVDFEGKVTAYRYDNTALGGGRTVGVYYYNSLTDYNNDPTLTSPVRSVLYAYDTFGRTIEIDDSGHGVTTNTFDTDGQLVTTASPEGIINYAYNDLGQKTRAWTSKTAAGTDAVTDQRFTYDGLGRLSSVELVEAEDAPVTGQTTTYRYDAAGAQAYEHSSATGITKGVVYDALGRPVELNHFQDTDADGDQDAGEHTIAKFVYTYDAAGNRTSAIETFDTTGDGVADLSQKFTWVYDGLNRLRVEVYDKDNDGAYDAEDYVTRYSFDHASNRTRVRKDMGSYDPAGTFTADEEVVYTYDENDRLLTEVKSDHYNAAYRNTRYTYVGTTQATKTVRQGATLDAGAVLDTVTQVYDVMGRLSKITVVEGGNTTITDYQYNADGLRVQATETVNGGTPRVTAYLYDPANHTGYAQILKERVDGSLAKTFVLGHDVLAQVAAGELLTLLYDIHGSTRALITTAGEIKNDTVGGNGMQAFTYDAYGNLLNPGYGVAAQANALTALLYSGEFTNLVTGLQYLRKRFYDPLAGRFNRLDDYAGSTSDPLSLHKYLYTHGNPVMGIDPSGFAAIDPGSYPYTGLRGQIVHAMFYAIITAQGGLADTPIGQLYNGNDLQAVMSLLRPDGIIRSGPKKGFYELKPITHTSARHLALATQSQMKAYDAALKGSGIGRGTSSMLFGRVPPMSPVPGGVFKDGGQTWQVTFYPGARTTPVVGNGKGLIYYSLKPINSSGEGGGRRRAPRTSPRTAPVTVTAPRTIQKLNVPQYIKDSILTLPALPSIQFSEAQAQATTGAVAAGIVFLIALELRVGFQAALRFA